VPSEDLSSGLVWLKITEGAGSPWYRASVLYILMKHADDPEQAIIRAVNDTRDNDTVAAIVGAAVGALHGKKALPDRWIENLSGRTSDSDDGHIFELLSFAKAIWGG
jgi:ADP-ribosylglycohydrolase